MRRKVLYLILPILLFLGLGYFFCFDFILTKTIRQSIQAITGAKVEIDKLHFSIITPSLQIGRLQIANPHDTWHNLIETKDIQFKLAWVPLCSGKIVIEKIVLSNLMLNTPRKTDGKLRKPLLPGPFAKEQAKLHHAMATIPLIDNNSMQSELTKNKDQILSHYKFQTTVDSERLKANFTRSTRTWNQDFTKQQDDINLQLQTIDQKLQTLKTTSLNNSIELNSAITSLNSMNQSVSSINSRLNNIKSGVQLEVNTISTAILNLKETADRDYHAILILAKIPDLNQINIAAILFGESLLKQSANLVALADKLQTFIPASTSNPPKEKHPRGGQDIIFPGRHTYPSFLIKLISISGRKTSRTNGVGFYGAGTITGITSEPAIYGHPIQIEISGETPHHSNLKLQGSINHINQAFDDRFNLKIANLKFPGLSLSHQRGLPDNVKFGSTEILSRFLGPTQKVSVAIRH